MPAATATKTSCGALGALGVGALVQRTPEGVKTTRPFRVRRPLARGNGRHAERLPAGEHAKHLRARPVSAMPPASVIDTQRRSPAATVIRLRVVLGDGSDAHVIIHLHDGVAHGHAQLFRGTARARSKRQLPQTQASRGARRAAVQQDFAARPIGLPAGAPESAWATSQLCIGPKRRFCARLWSCSPRPPGTSGTADCGQATVAPNP